MNSINLKQIQNIIHELEVLRIDSIQWSMDGNANCLEGAIQEAEEDRDIGWIRTAQVYFQILGLRFQTGKV